MSIRERIDKIIEKAKSLQNHPSDYPELLWVVFVFLGGTINAVAIRNFAVGWNYTVQFGLISTLLFTLAIGSILFCVPLFFSWFFSRNHPTKRLVPPLYIHAVTFGLLFFFVYNNVSEDFLSYYVLGIYSFLVGKIQDGIMLSAFGKNAVSDNIIHHSFKVLAEFSKVEEIVLKKQFRNLLNLKRKINKKDESLKLRTSKNDDWQLILEIKETGKKNETIINLAFYDEGSYSLKKIQKTDDSYEYAISKMEYIKSYFSRRFLIQIEDAPLTNAESLVTFVLDDFQGKISRLHEMTTQKKISLFLAIGLIATSIGLMFYGLIGEGIATLFFAIGLIVNVIPR